jgi:predicted membrane GTPase involved in stress response
VPLPQIGETLCNKEAPVALPCPLLSLSRDTAATSSATDLLLLALLQIGETLCSKEAPVALPTIKVEEPTVSMTFKVRCLNACAVA